MRILIVTAILLLTACTKTILIPEACPSPVIPSEPHYPIQDLRPGDGPDKVAKAYVATTLGQKEYIAELKQILAGYSE